MSNKELVYMINMLSDENRKAVEIIVKNLYDPDYTKLIPKERNLDALEQETEIISQEEFEKELDI